MLDLIIFAKLLLVIGGIVWGIYGVFSINIIKRILPNETLQKIVYILVGISALLLIFNRNYYLPFLDKTVLPYSFIKNEQKPLNSTLKIEVQVEPNSRVIYWGAESNKKSSKEIPVEIAYGEFSNSGITTADCYGKAVLTLRNPSGYNVKKGFFKKHLKPHVHYRYTLKNGMMSEVFTKMLDREECSSKSSNSSKSSESSESSRSSESPRSPRDDLTNLHKCKCANRHLNIHNFGCKKQFINDIIPNPAVGMAAVVGSPKSANVQNYDKLTNYETFDNFSQNLFDKDIEKNRSLNSILKDRDLNSNVNIDEFPQVFYENDETFFDENFSSVE